MRWLTVAGVLLYLTRCNDAGVLKCHPGSSDPLCAKNTEISSNLIDRDSSSEESEERNLFDIGLISDESQESQCQPGSTWESHCHFCHCTRSGLAECIEIPACIGKQYEKPIPCRPNTTFERYGETCICLANGQGLCALQSHIVKKRSPKEGPGEKCTPGSSFQIDCNTCHCLDNGRAACTKRGCLGVAGNTAVLLNRDITEVPPHKQVSKRSVCKPHYDFNMDCNPCKCAADGLTYSCTHNECLEGGEEDANKEVEVFMETEGTDHVEQHTVCKPRSAFYVGCNTCRCNFQGTDYSCTDKPCPLPADVELFHELKEPTSPTSSKVERKTNSTRVVCLANRMFIKDCNTCWCNEDGTSYFCTRRVCSENNGENGEDPNEELKLREIKKECTPNEVFEMDCNMCRCNEDGKSFSCTRRACVEVDDKNTTSRSARALSNGETPKTCQAGQEFRMDCNKCLCNDAGTDFSCTRIDCAAVNNGGADRTKRDTTTVEHKCEPGSVFDRACNVCRCTADGQHAVCQLKRCNKETETTTDSSPAFRCTPGDQFRRDCNDCTCSADGKNVFCTLRLCDDPTILP